MMDGDQLTDYVENGVAKADGAYKLPDGKWYVFDKSGRMLSSVRAKKGRQRQQK